ncbi:hypothetical protein GNI_023270, partial [Gregarina niphandrodes]
MAETLYLRHSGLSKIVRHFLFNYDERICLSKSEQQMFMMSCTVNLAHCEYIRKKFKNSVKRLSTLRSTNTLDQVMITSLRAFNLLHLQEYAAMKKVLEESKVRCMLQSEQNYLRNRSATGGSACEPPCPELYRLYSAGALMALAQDDLFDAIQATHSLTEYDHYECHFITALIHARIDGMIGDTSLFFATIHLKNAIASSLSTAHKRSQKNADKTSTCNSSRSHNSNRREGTSDARGGNRGNGRNGKDVVPSRHDSVAKIRVSNS